MSRSRRIGAVEEALGLTPTGPPSEEEAAQALREELADLSGSELIARGDAVARKLLDRHHAGEERLGIDARKDLNTWALRSPAFRRSLSEAERGLLWIDLPSVEGGREIPVPRPCADLPPDLMGEWYRTLHRPWARPSWWEDAVDPGPPPGEG